MLRKMAQIPEWTCNIYNKSNAKYMCYDSAHILCDCCKDLHDKFPANKPHTVREVDSNISTVKNECEIHKKDYLHFCQSCDSLICSDCVTTEHNGHVFKGLKDVTEKARKTVSDAIFNLKAIVVTLREMMEKIRSTDMAKIQNDAEDFISKVHHLSKSLIGIIQIVEKRHATFASDYLDLERTHLKYSLAKLSRSLDEHCSVCQKIENVLVETHNTTFYLNQAKIMKELHSIDDIPRLEEAKDLVVFISEDLVDQIVEDIQQKHGIRLIQSQEKRFKELTERLTQERTNHQKANETVLAEKITVEKSILIKDIQMKKITEQLMQEKINHQQTKDSALSEEITLGVSIQSKDLQITELN